jgi:hypothetical protein
MNCKEGRCITLTILANADPSGLNRVEQDYISSERENFNGGAPSALLVEPTDVN